MHRLRGCLLALLAIALSGALPAVAAAAITGTVYMDYNSNGQRDLGGYEIGTQAKATDVPVAGVTVTAYDETGTQVGTATSAVDGTYTLAPSTGDRIRLEFSVPTGYQPSGVGSQNGTSVRFVSPNATNVDFAVTKPDTYCQDNPLLISCMAPYLGFGGSLMGAFTMPSRFSTPITVNANGILPSLPGIKGGTQVTTAGALGSTFGLGVDRNGNAYYGTYVKRHAPYAASNSARGNVVYKVNVATGAIAPFVTLGGATLPAHDARIASGTNGDGSPWPAYAVDGLRADNNSNDVYHMVGRAGIGDVDVSADGSTLWAVEMTETAPMLWNVPIGGSGATTTPGTPVSYAITRPTTYGSGATAVTCEGTWHPMGIGLSDDQLLVGGVCGVETIPPQLGRATFASSTGGVATLEFANDAAVSRIAVGDRLGFDSWKPSGSWWAWGAYPNGNSITEQYNYVQVTAKTTVADGGVASVSFAIPASWGDLARRSVTQTSVLKTVAPNAFILSFDRATGAFSTLFGFSTGYPKSGTGHTWMASPQSLWSNMWQSWYDGDLRPLNLCSYYPNFFDGDWCRGTPPQWGKPMLANIEIQADGSLTLGFRDRMADQSAANTVDYESPGVNSPRMQADPSTAVADMVQVCRSGGGYALEVGGACGAVRGANVPSLLRDEPQSIRDASSLYWANGLFMNHPNTSLGGLAQMPGVKVLWSTTYDVSGYDSQGIRAMGPCAVDDTTCGPRPADDGAFLGGSDLTTTNQPTYCGTDASCWKKGNGLGDLEVLCNAAPVEIGNRVWTDWNNNGIQDAGEGPIAGVTVRLYDANNQLVGTAVTDANGTYYFSSLSIAGPNGDGSNVGGGLVPGAAFTVRLDKASDYTAGGLLEGMTLTTGNVATQGDDVDSDATMVGGYPEISILPRSAGQNNHTFDIGFHDPNPPLVGMGNYTWIDADDDGIQDNGELSLPGVSVQLLYADGSIARDAAGNPVAPVVTDANGYYYIGNLRPDTYQVRFSLPRGYMFTTPSAGTDSAVDSNAVATDNLRVGLTPAFPVYRRPAGDTRLAAQGESNAAYVDPTIDAGVVVMPRVGMGNYTWVDTDKDGIQDNGEASLPGVTVQLLNADGTPAVDYDGVPVAPVVTDANGYYYIGNLAPGSYRAQFSLPRGYVFTTPDAGSDPAVNSNPEPTDEDPLVGVTPAFTIGSSASGETRAALQSEPDADFVNPTIDAGVVVAPRVGMGNYTWIDANKDGLQGADESPLPGVTVALLNPDGSPALDYDGNPVAPVLTDADGRYFIGNLLPGQYRARFTLPSGYTFTTPGVGPSGDDSNPAVGTDPLVGVTPVFIIGASATGDTTAVTAPDAEFANLTIDAGVIPVPVSRASTEPRVAVGNYVWFDRNDNGKQDRREKPMAGVKVRLFTKDGRPAVDAAGNSVPVKTTDAKGYYVFDGLAPGEYYVEFETPRRYTFTVDGRGTSANGSNPKVSRNPRIARTPVFQVHGGVRGNTVANTNPSVNASFIDPTIDAGVVPQCTRYTFDKTLIYMGERVRVTVTAKLNGVLQRNKTVTLKGLGVHLTGTTNAKGQVGFWVEPEKGGLLVASSPDAMPGCSPQAVTVSTSMFPVTG